LVVATTGLPQSAKMSVAGYFEWVGWKATLDAFTGKAYFSFSPDGAVFGGLLGVFFGATEEVTVPAGAFSGVGAAEVGAGAAVCDGSTNCGVTVAAGVPPGVPQAASENAATVKIERVRRETTEPSWQKASVPADPPPLDRLAGSGMTAGSPASVFSG
jgi:hypothetical protein